MQGAYCRARGESIQGGKEASIVLILIFCNFYWLEEEAVYNLAIYNHGYTGVHGQEGGISNKEQLSIIRPIITLLLFVVLCNRPAHHVIRSLSQLPGSHRWCLCFYPALLSQNLDISKAIYCLLILSHSPYYAIILHPSTGCLIFHLLPQYYGPCVAVAQRVSVCLLFVYSAGEKGGGEHPFVYTLSEERQCQSISGRGEHLDGNATSRGRGAALQLK